MRPVRAEVYQPACAAFDSSHGTSQRRVGGKTLTLGPLHLSRNDPRSWRTAGAGLILAAAIVGLAIVVGGSTARVLNPIGAVLWLASEVFLAVS